MKRTIQSYSATFKAEAVKDIANYGGNVSAAARGLRLPMQTLSNWQKKSEPENLKGTEQYDLELMVALNEIKELKC